MMPAIRKAFRLVGNDIVEVFTGIKFFYWNHFFSKIQVGNYKEQ